MDKCCSQLEKQKTEIEPLLELGGKSSEVIHTVLAVSACISFLGLLGVIGGMDNNSIGLVPGVIWAAIFLAAWVVSLDLGGWIE